jgi:hypothetical protein
MEHHDFLDLPKFHMQKEGVGQTNKKNSFIFFVCVNAAKPEIKHY